MMLDKNVSSSESGNSRHGVTVGRKPKLTDFDCHSIARFTRRENAASHVTFEERETRPIEYLGA